VGKAIKYNFAFCVAGGAGEKRNFDLVLNLKYFIQAARLLWPPNISSFFCGPLEA
jgi:hypothetical protein